jgi:hypothetical protein
MAATPRSSFPLAGHCANRQLISQSVGSMFAPANFSNFAVHLQGGVVLKMRHRIICL